MGLFDFLSKPKDGGLKKHAERAQNKRAQAPDRWESIQALSRMGTEEAIAALLPRFDFYVDPSITDQEEKEAAFQGVVSAGETAVAPVQAYLKRAESLSWGLKILDRLLSPDEVRKVLLAELADMDTEYERDPQRKLQVLAELETRRGDDVVEAVLPFLEDVNETARFHAAGAVLAQENRELAREALTQALAQEESMRVKARVLEGFANHGWPVEAAELGRLPEGFRLGAKGVPERP